MARQNEQKPKRERKEAVSLAPLSVTEAVTGLFAIRDPDATKPERKKAPPTPDEG